MSVTLTIPAGLTGGTDDSMRALQEASRNYERAYEACVIAAARFREAMAALPRPSMPSDLSAIMAIVCNYHLLTFDQLRGRCRDRQHAEARQLFCHLARRLTKHSTTIIGRVLCRDHSAICYAEFTWQDRLDTEGPEFRREYDRLFKTAAAAIAEPLKKPDHENTRPL
ncbi:hypothetical protein OPIT5_08215 [Opitutaceae bacterium TAV5]|nr:hypothetical protein OPIT5_08215 [Opitutaceae bacterium TAV5]